jgi:hypothetical protein
MSTFVMVVGKSLCLKRVEAYLTAHENRNYICVDGPDMAEQLMQDGCTCDVLIMDRSLSPEFEPIEDWIADHSQAVTIMTDTVHIQSSDFLGQLDAAFHRSDTEEYRAGIKYDKTNISERHASIS